jgi:excisionase family DNA binding protein
MPEPFTEARLLTANEVADLMRVSRMTVYRMIKDGEMPAVRVGRGYRLREDDVPEPARGPKPLAHDATARVLAGLGDDRG